MILHYNSGLPKFRKSDYNKIETFISHLVDIIFLSVTEFYQSFFAEYTKYTF